MTYLGHIHVSLSECPHWWDYGISNDGLVTVENGDKYTYDTCATCASKKYEHLAQGGEVVSRQTHILEVVGSNPAPATS